MGSFVLAWQLFWFVIWFKSLVFLGKKITLASLKQKRIGFIHIMLLVHAFLIAIHR